MNPNQQFNWNIQLSTQSPTQNNNPYTQPQTQNTNPYTQTPSQHSNQQIQFQQPQQTQQQSQLSPAPMNRYTRDTNGLFYLRYLVYIVYCLLVGVRCLLSVSIVGFLLSVRLLSKTYIPQTERSGAGARAATRVRRTTRGTGITPDPCPLPQEVIMFVKC
jgi:hypothetical protein